MLLSCNYYCDGKFKYGETDPDIYPMIGEEVVISGITYVCKNITNNIDDNEINHYLEEK